MPNTLRLHWPKADAGPEKSRYARALEHRLQELGVALAAADDADAIDADAASAPLVNDLDCLIADAGTSLSCRPDPAVVTVVAFTDTLDADEAARLRALRAHLAELSPYPVDLIVIASAASRVAAGARLLDGDGIACRCALDADFARLLLTADAALVAGRGQNLLDAACAGVPALVCVAETDADAASLGLAVSGATPAELAGLLLLLVAEPGVRRKVLDAQDRLRQTHSPDAQRRAVAAWLAGLGIDVPSPLPDGAPPVLRVEGVFDSSYSLAIVNRQLAMALQDLGETVALYTYEQGADPQPAWQAVEEPERIRAMWTLGRSPQPPAVSLRNAWPPVVRDMRARRRVLASYAWEESAFPAAFAADFNLGLDLLTVVSTQTARFLRDAGVITPMAVVGNGVDHLLGVPAEPLPRALPPARFRFLHVSSCFPRKGVDVLLEAYGNAFSSADDVALVIKTFPNPHNDVRAQLERHRRESPSYPRVEIIEEDWTPGQLAGLYQQCHALVAPSRGEGFGLPIAEAMLYELPVIVTAWGGHRDFCSPETCWLIDYTPQFARTHIGLSDSLWAEPDAAHLTALLREVHDLPRTALRQRTIPARQRVLADCSWRRVAERTRAALRALDERPGLPSPLHVGWMSTWGSRCGIAAYSSHMVGAFAGDRLHLFAPYDEEVDVVDPSVVRRNWVLQAAQLDRLVADARSLELDALVVQFHWGFFGLDALVGLLGAMKGSGIKVFIDFHNTRSAPFDVRAAHVVAALAAAERLLVHTLDDMQRLKGLGLADNVTLFPLAVYPVRQPSPAAVDAASRRLGLHDRQVIASYGFLLPHKGLLQLVEAMPALLAARPRLHLLMANAVYSAERSGAERDRIVERIGQLGLADRVTLVNDFLPEEESLALLKTADLVVFPYQQSEESSSAAVRMALVAGCPVAVTPLPIFADVASAVSVLPGTGPGELADGIAQVLVELDEPQAQAAARARAADFVASRSAELLSRRLRNMIAGCCDELSLEGQP